MSFRVTRTTQVLNRPTVHARVVREDGLVAVASFVDTFCIGRDDSCDLQIDSGLASRRHVEVAFEGNCWNIRDLGSTNGSFVDGERIQEVALLGHIELRLGKDGPRIGLEVAGTPLGSETDARGGVRGGRTLALKASSAPPLSGSRKSIPARAEETPPDPSLSQYVAKYFGDASSPGGEHTQMIRRAYERVQHDQRRKYLRIGLAGAALVALLAVYTGWQQIQMSRLERRASEAFGTMKQLDVQAAKLQQYIEERGDASLSEQFSDLANLRARTRMQYEGYVEELGIRRRLTQEEAVIYRVARIFNESEFEVPARFVRAVRQTIDEYWLTGAGRGRFERAIMRAEEEGSTQRIVGSMMRHGLPPEFFYLGLQESNFDPRVVGPSTRWGIAKGMWQFIPETARAYGLVVGPREDQRVYDPQDDRHDPAAATDAAARYLLEIYGQLTQASGLLAMASYNWGEHRVVGRLHQLMEGIPDDPEARSYWRFLTEYSTRMPDETKDYVLKIFAAAVIGQNPRLFGFDFDNPLQPHIEAASVEANGLSG